MGTISYDHKQLVDVLLLVILSWYEPVNGKENRRYVLRYESGPIRSDTCIVLPQVVKTLYVLGVHLRKRERSTVAFENGQHAV